MIRVMASMLVRDGVMVKGRGFASDRVVGDPVAWARVMAQVREVDELVVFSIGRKPADLDLISRIASECFVPLAYGGGIYSVEDAERVVALGCDKVVLMRGVHFIPDLVRRIGSQSVVGCVDYGIAERWAGMFTVGMAEKRATEFVNAGAGEIIVQGVCEDGTLGGYNIGLVESLSKVVDVPLVASSGCYGPRDMLDAVNAGADAVCAGALWQFTDATPKGAKQFLRENGVEVRL